MKGCGVRPIVPRCETSLSSHEVALGYRENTPDPSVFIKFRVTETPDGSTLDGFESGLAHLYFGLDYHPLDVAGQYRSSRCSRGGVFPS